MKEKHYPAPTKNERIRYMEALLHQLNAARTAGNVEAIHQLLNRIDDWSYAHRVGNGALTDRQQQQLIHKAFWNKIAGVDYGEM